MMNILKLDVDVKAEDRGVSIKFISGVGSKFSEMITNEEQEKVVDLIKEIADIASGAIKRELMELEKDLEKKLPPEIKEKMRKIEERINNLESPEDVLDFLSKMLEGK